MPVPLTTLTGRASSTGVEMTPVMMIHCRGNARQRTPDNDDAFARRVRVHVLAGCHVIAKAGRRAASTIPAHPIFSAPLRWLAVTPPLAPPWHALQKESLMCTRAPRSVRKRPLPLPLRREPAICQIGQCWVMMISILLLASLWPLYHRDDLACLAHRSFYRARFTFMSFL